MNWDELILSSPVEQVFRNNPTIVSLYECIEEMKHSQELCSKRSLEY